MQGNLRSRLGYFVFVIFILILDRATKAAIVSRFDLGQSFSVIDGFFNITYVQNTGVAFGMLSTVSSPLKALVLCIIAGVAVTAVVIFSLRHDAHNRLLQSALAMILAGALGNLYDRIRFSYVIDFLELHARSFYWPSFNVADAAISAGVILLAWEMFRHETPART